MTITASIIGQTFVTLMVNGNTETITNDHTNYGAIRDAIRLKNYDLAESLINVKIAVENFSTGAIRVENDSVFYGDFKLENSVVVRILAMIREGFDAAPMIKFLENLMSNPSKRAVDELYGFLESSELPITEDGYFLAYKKVNDQYKDFYTGKMDNSIGSKPSMPRNMVDEEKNNTCSHGLHFCSFNYLSQYYGGCGRVVILKINPKDVVSIPSDYNNAKGRACEYEIIGEHEAKETTTAFTSPVYNNATPVAPPKPISSPTSVATPAVKRSPSLVGYNSGRSDAARNFKNEYVPGDFVGNDAASYKIAYEKGYNSLLKPVADFDETEYNNGYKSGKEDALRDSKNNMPYDDAAVNSTNIHYINGYHEGYADNFGLSLEEIAFDKGHDDAKTGNQYSDTLPVFVIDNADNKSIWKINYASGWYTQKTENL